MKFEYVSSFVSMHFNIKSTFCYRWGIQSQLAILQKKHNLPMEPSSNEGEIKIEIRIDFAYVFNFDQFRVLGEYNNTLQFCNYNLAVSHRKMQN